MMAPSMMGGMDQNVDPNERRKRMMLQMLMQNSQQGGNSAAGGANQIGSALVSAMLMNPDFGKSLKEGFSGLFDGVGNVANGYQWGGMPGSDMLDNLTKQAGSNIKYGGAL